MAKSTKSRGKPGACSPQMFRKIALELPGAEELSHMKHPDFRVNGRIFATLGYPDASWGMVRLPPEAQEGFIQQWPDTFRPAAGAWGRQGCTIVRLDAVSEDILAGALTLAWQTASQPKPAGARKRSK